MKSKQNDKFYEAKKESCCHYPNAGHCWHCESIKEQGKEPEMLINCRDWKKIK